ncbi:MAG: hypothetical protein BAJALOKI2v1_410027 [Promethearchaeota archaeon]|nr:MAG: hypothetical protein BAJALOKI2v1_410027 [Candidatus Lokiarchaeota archaeon]
MSEENLQVCRFCQRNVKIAYYCEACGTSCCSDCLHEEKVDFFSCQDCGSKNIEILHSQNKKICKDCESENIIKVSQLTKSCPKCHSEKIINIYEKKEELELKFLDLIKNTRNFTEPFKNFIDQLRNLKKKVREARAPPIKCYHFPKMEPDLLGIFKSVICLKESLIDRINVHFRHLASNIEYFFNVYSQPNTNIRIIEGILDNLNRGYDSINEFIKSNIDSIKENIDKIEKNLTFIEKITKYFNQYKHFINLADNEKPIYAINAKLSEGVNGIDVFKKSKGMLFITNMDLSFVHEYGLIKKKQDLIFKAPVDDLIRIKEKGKLFKKLYIEFAYGKYEFSLPSDAISRVIEYILLARNFDETAIYDREAANHLNKIDTDLNDLKNYIEEGINKFFIIRCKYDNTQYMDDEVGEQYDDGCDYPDEEFRFEKSMGKFPSVNQNKRRSSSQNQFEQRYSSFKSTNENIPNFYANSGKNAPECENGNHQSKENLNNFWNREINRANQRGNMPFNNSYGKKSQRNNINNEKRRSPYDKRAGFINNDRRNQNYPRYSAYGKKSGRRGYKQKSSRNTSRNPNFNRVNSTPGLTGNSFGDYNHVHLNPYFNEPSYPNSQEFDPSDIQDEDEYLLELRKTKYSLEETLNNLEKMFEQERISKRDYFKKYQELKAELYSVNETIKSFQNQMEHQNSFQRYKRDYDNKKYFS